MDEQGLPAVLVVDDDQATLELIGRYLSSLSISPILTNDAEKALVLLTENRGNIRLVFLDLAMPRTSGFELAKAIRKLEDLQALPLVVITARRELEAHHAALSTGVDEVISKPFDPKLLKHILVKYGVISL